MSDQLAKETAEPVAWFYEEKGWMPGDGRAEFSEYRWDEHQRANWIETPLYAAPSRETDQRECSPAPVDEHGLTELRSGAPTLQRSDCTGYAAPHDAQSSACNHDHPTVAPALSAEAGMTDPNKAAVTESNAEFIARMKEITTLYENPQQLPPGAFMRLIALAEERVMIEEHKLRISHNDENHYPYEEIGFRCWLPHKVDEEAIRDDLSDALRSVVAKIGEENEP